MIPSSLLSVFSRIIEEHVNSGFVYTAQKMKFSIKDLVTLTEEILNGKLHFFCSVSTWKNISHFLISNMDLTSSVEAATGGVL